MFILQIMGYDGRSMLDYCRGTKAYIDACMTVSRASKKKYTPSYWHC